MATVTFDGTRVNNADSLTGWSGVQEPDFVYQGSYSVSVKVKTTEAGPYYSGTGYAFNTTRRTAILKVICTNFSNLNNTPSTSAIMEVGSSTSAFYRYYIATDTTYPITGGWLIVPIDPYLSGYRDATTGTPNLSSIAYYSWQARYTSTSKSENTAMDAIDFINNGTGLTLTGTSGSFTDFVTFDEGTSTNRYGIISTKEGIIFVTGVLTIGTATLTAFTGSLKTLVFPSGRFDTGFCGIDLGLQNASTTISLSACTFIGRGQAANDGASADSRPDFGVTGTSGAATIDACLFVNFNSIVLTSGVTLTDTTFNTCNALTQASATMDNCTFDSHTTVANTAFMTANNISLITNCSFVSGGTGHAIVITSTTGTPFTFTGNTFIGYGGTPGSNLTSNSGSGDAAIYNLSGGAITINITGGGTTPSVRNGAGATTTINSNITITITVQDEGASPIIGAQVSAYKTSDNSTIITPTTTNASGEVTGSAAAGTGAIYIRVRQSNTADSTRYYPTSTVGTIGGDDFSVTITMTEDTTVT